MKECFIESALGSHRPKGFEAVLRWEERLWKGRRSLASQWALWYHEKFSGGSEVSSESPWGSVLAGCWIDHGEWCSGMSQHWALCWHHPSQRDDKTSCFSPKLCSLPEGINLKDTEKESQMVWAACMVTAHPWDATLSLDRSSRGHGPCYPLLSSTHLSPQGIAHLISHKTCVTSKAHVMNEIKCFAKCRKTSLIPGTAVWDFPIAAITCFSWAQKKSVISLVCPLSCSMTPSVAHRMSSSSWLLHQVERL